MSELKVVIFVNDGEITVLGIPEEQVKIIRFVDGYLSECPNCSGEQGEELQGGFCWSCGSDWSDKEPYQIYEELTNE